MSGIAFSRLTQERKAWRKDHPFVSSIQHWPKPPGGWGGLSPQLLMNGQDGILHTLFTNPSSLIPGICCRTNKKCRWNHESHELGMRYSWEERGNVCLDKTRNSNNLYVLDYWNMGRTDSFMLVERQASLICLQKCILYAVIQSSTKQNPTK